ncbi:MAG: hypothetical protein ACM3UQ_00060 [Clostridiales bacterium]
MVDIDVIVNDLDDLVAGILGIRKERTLSGRSMSPAASLINVSVNITAHSFDDSIAGGIREKLYQNNENREPLVDVIETSDKIRIIATLPGIRAEDVWYETSNGVLTVEITKYGQVIKKEIKCSSKPGQILLKSSTVNNSVLELVFDKV